MPGQISKRRYDEANISRLARLLDNSHQEFEVRVDGFTVIPRGQDTSKFESITDFIDENTHVIEVLVYKGASNVNDKHFFLFDSSGSGLGNTDEPGAESKYHIRAKEDEIKRLQAEIESLKGSKMTQKQFDDFKRDWETAQLKKELAEALERAKSAEKRADNRIAEIEAKSNSLGGILGAVVPHALASLAKTPGFQRALPGLAGLAALAGNETAEPGDGPDDEHTGVGFATPANDVAAQVAALLRESYDEDEQHFVLEFLARAAQQKFLLRQLARRAQRNEAQAPVNPTNANEQAAAGQ
jgi:hypothetical protein